MQHAGVLQHLDQGDGCAAQSKVVSETALKPREFFIQGTTLDGQTFRPSDWAERLAGALASFRPGAAMVTGGVGRGIGAHIGYSPYCIPKSLGNVKCVVVDERLRDIEPMAWDFAMNFANDNRLTVVEACLLPEPAAADLAPNTGKSKAGAWRRDVERTFV